MNFYELKISTSSREESLNLLKLLIEEKILSGGNVIETDACFYWKNKVNETKDYILTSIVCCKDPSTVEKRISELTEYEDPLISFVKIDYLNQKAMDHIKKNTDILG